MRHLLLLGLRQHLLGLLVELLHPRAHLAGLRIELDAHAGGLLVELRVALHLVRLVGRREGVLQPREDRLEGDALVPLELSQRLDQVLIHVLRHLLFSARSLR